MHWNVVVIAIGQLILISHAVAAQSDSASHPGRERAPARAWIVPAGIAAAAALDPELREWTLHRHTRSLDRLAKSVNPFGTEKRLVPAMAVTYAIASVTHQESLANATLNTGAAYLATMPNSAALSARRITFASSDIRRTRLTIPNRNPTAPIAKNQPTNCSSSKNAAVTVKPGGGPPVLPGRREERR